MRYEFVEFSIEIRILCDGLAKTNCKQIHILGEISPSPLFSGTAFIQCLLSDSGLVMKKFQLIQSCCSNMLSHWDEYCTRTGQYLEPTEFNYFVSGRQPS